MSTFWLESVKGRERLEGMVVDGRIKLIVGK
jgi:hypothetical protein